jgi:outer membrane protein assembly factor BamB
MGLRASTARLAAALLVLLAAPAQAADWGTFGFDSERTGANPLERALGVDNVGRLRQAWSAPLEGIVNAQPLVAADVPLPGGRRAELVIAGTERGVLSAHDARTGARIWRQALGVRRTRCTDLPKGLYGISSTPVLDRRLGVVYAVAGDGRAHALDLATGRERRGWPVRITSLPAREYVWGALNLDRGRLYVPVSSHCSNAFYRGRVVRIDVRTASVDRTWYSLSPRRRGGGMWGWGGTTIDRDSGDVYVATADALAPPAHAPGADSVFRLSRDLRPLATHRPPTAEVQDSEFGGAPLLLRAPGCPPQLAVLHKSGLLLLYDRLRLSAGPRQSLQIGRPGLLGAYGTYAWSAGARTLFVANNSSGDLAHGLLGLRLDETCRLARSWSAQVGPDPAILSPPVTANGVVYLGTGFGRELWAFDAATGAVLWSAPGLEGAVYGAPTVANGRLYVAGWDELLRAYGPTPP